MELRAARGHRDCCSQRLAQPTVTQHWWDRAAWAGDPDSDLEQARALCCCSPSALSRTHCAALAPAPRGEAACSRPDKPPWPVCAAQGAEKGNERVPGPCKGRRTRLCSASWGHTWAPPSALPRMLVLLTCSCTLQTLSPGDPFPLGQMEKLWFVCFQISQECSPAVQALRATGRSLGIPQAAARGPRGTQGDAQPPEQVFWRVLMFRQPWTLEGFGDAGVLSSLGLWEALPCVAVIKKQNLTLSLV